MFGSWLLMIEHTGRKTGARRYAVLEVIGRPRPGTYIVGSVPRAQWYRNIQADPRVRVSVGFRNAAEAVAKPVTGEEAAAVLDGYIRRHPRRWAAMRPTFEKYLGGPVAGAPMAARLPASGAGAGRKTTGPFGMTDKSGTGQPGEAPAECRLVT